MHSSWCCWLKLSLFDYNDFQTSDTVILVMQGPSFYNELGKTWKKTHDIKYPRYELMDVYEVHISKSFVLIISIQTIQGFF